MKAPPTFAAGIVCAACGTVAVRTGPVQKYCRPCSDARNIERKAKWARGAGRPSRPDATRRPMLQTIGRQASVEAARSITHETSRPELHWLTRISVPFSYAASKNHIYALNGRGHVHLRSESSAIRDEITLRVKMAVRDQRVFHNKVWLDILVQKSNHKGDAVNVVDLVCDGVKRAVGVDDRWFCIRSLDWEIVRENPMIFIGVGQEATCDAQVCCYCGQIKPVADFQKSKHGHLGIGRECKPCLSALSKQRRETKRAAKGAA